MESAQRRGPSPLELGFFRLRDGFRNTLNEFLEISAMLGIFVVCSPILTWWRGVYGSDKDPVGTQFCLLGG